MKAIRVHQFGEPDVLKLGEVPDPTPGPGQIVVRIRAIGVNPYEAYIRAGTYPEKPSLPYTPGADAAGVIESVGPGVTAWKPAARVYTVSSVTGTYAELALCTADQLCSLPSNISFSQGAALNVPYGTAYRALFDRGRAAPGETVLIHGATGGVGLAAVQLAVARGLIVIATGGSEEGRELVRKQGAAHVLDHHAADHVDHVMKLTDGRGVDLVLEMLANVNLDRDLQLAAKLGRVVVIGSRGRVEIDPRLTMGKELDVLGVTYWALGMPGVLRAHAHIGAGLRNGSLKPIIGAEFPLAQAAKAHRKIMDKGALGKIVLTV